MSILINGDCIYVGNFNVAKHIQAEESKALKATTGHVLIGLALFLMGCGLLL